MTFNKPTDVNMTKVGTTKNCSKCGQTKALDEFYNSLHGSLGKCGQCRDCILKTARLKMFDKYKLTAKEYDQLRLESKEVCAICGAHQNQIDRSLHLDHCHTTGKPRGFLCPGCNGGLGMFKENKQIFINAMKYLDTHI